ncbi:MAG: J domain-containing protein [Oligoflexia bacterium]|nr:J domain-containing protein [Oligoflexia bacterium]
MNPLFKLIILVFLVASVSLAASEELLNYKNAISILGVYPGADKITITKAFRRLAMKYHPDRVALEQKREGEEKFIKIRLAYEYLAEMGFESPPSDKEINTFSKDYAFGLEMIFNPINSYILYKKYKDAALSAMDNKNISELSQLLLLTNPGTTSIFIIELLRHKYFFHFKDFFIQKLSMHKFSKNEVETFKVVLHAFSRIKKPNFIDEYFSLLRNQSDDFVHMSMAPAYISLSEIIKLKHSFINEVKNGGDALASALLWRLVSDGRSNAHYKLISEIISIQKGYFSAAFFVALLQHPKIRGSQILLADTIKRVDYETITPLFISTTLPNTLVDADNFVNFLIQRNNLKLIKTIIEGLNQEADYTVFDSDRKSLIRQRATLLERSLKIKKFSARLKYLQKHFGEQGRFLELFDTPHSSCLNNFMKLVKS